MLASHWLNGYFSFSTLNTTETFAPPATSLLTVKVCLFCIFIWGNKSFYHLPPLIIATLVSLTCYKSEFTLPMNSVYFCSAMHSKYLCQLHRTEVCVLVLTAFFVRTGWDAGRRETDDFRLQSDTTVQPKMFFFKCCVISVAWHTFDCRGNNWRK